jgi:arylsulfatase A-like enzyme/Tfp pilus assembly protein PilF
MGIWWTVGRGAVHVPRSADQNVLLVTIDTLRADALGRAGGAAATPNLDRLAREGVAFDFAHGHAVVTLPSHASILTGLHPFEHGVRDNTGFRLGAEHPTAATILRAQGYSTGAFIGAFPLDSRFGLDRGFDVYDDGYGETSRVAELLMPERRAGAVVEAATRWIGAQPGKWFAWVHVYDPHAPYKPPAPFDQQYARDAYAGEVAYTDSALGPLLDLARRGPRPTLVVVTADHGEALGSHGEQTHGVFAYEPSLKVPLIVSFTSRPDAFGGRASDIQARHIDVLPTLLDGLGSGTAGAAPGRSLLRALESGADEPVATYFEALSPSLNRGWAPLHGVLAGREKYIDVPIPELYDLSTDPGEAHNLADSRVDRRQVLDARLRGFDAARHRAERIAESPDVVRQLQALGYVSASAPRKAHYTEEDDPKRLVAIDAAIQRGITLFQEGRGREALDLFRDLIRRRPTMAVSYLHAAYLLWDLGEPRSAIEMLKSALRAGASTAEVQSQLGIYLAEAGEPAEAIAVLEPLATSPAPDVEALNALGIAKSRSGRPEEALREFRRILEIDPSNASALQNVGAVHLGRNELAEAREMFTRALAIDPRLARALNGLGVVELRTGNRQAAIESWRRAVDADPRQYDTIFNLGVTLMESGDRAGARRYFEAFVRSAPPAFYAADIDKVRRWLEAM